VVKSYTYFNENLIGINQFKSKVLLNKPIFIGQCVLDSSKVIMYEFYYNFIMKKFNPENVKLLLTDTDSLILHIKKEDPYEIMKQNKFYFDLSEFPKDSDMYDPTNKKIIGKFSDEMTTNYISEFVGLRSKMYALRTEDYEVRKCKGIKKHIVKKDLRFEQYKEALFGGVSISAKQSTIRSYKHKIYTEEVEKVALSACDDKVYILDNNIDTLTFRSKINTIV
jgi:hypothetical protein